MCRDMSVRNIRLAQIKKKENKIRQRIEDKTTQMETISKVKVSGILIKKAYKGI
jgi:gas vesicle protein